MNGRHNIGYCVVGMFDQNIAVYKIQHYGLGRLILHGT